MDSWQQLSGLELLEKIPTPAIVVSSAGDVAFGNRWACELFERDLNSASFSVEDLLTQPERARLDPLAWLRKWADTPEAPELDYVYLTCITASGDERVLSVRVARLAVGDEADYLVTMHDMTNWQQRLTSERESHRVASRLLSITADAVIITDEALSITYANQSAERLFGYDQGGLLGLSLSTLIPDRFRDQHQDHVAQFAADKSPSRLMSERSTVMGLTRTGNEVPVEASITRLNIKGSAVFSALLRAKGTVE